MQNRALAPLGAAGQLTGAGKPTAEHVFNVNIGQAYVLCMLRLANWRKTAAGQGLAYIELFYHEQGREGTACVTPGFLDGIAR